ncbi:XylR N-terminal domain-containing protein [Tenuibacillus multivorans]|uniref:Sugar diacid utilization regulator n=1 Tax=Tenuibacillus multivorans TaxID=237069 RepID=A0A1H0ES83_9BACI|nr:XylR N-terminal domain-containing protein [Tenuibacillus multivorans]SDN85176.1 Sugar diacid utilization regulator [Tenuibacillus multivorans]
MDNQLFESISNQKGYITVDGERMILTSPSVFGTLIKDLVNNLSEERMKGFMIRYGWNLGVNDARKILKEKSSSFEELLKHGPVLHMMRGYTEVERTHFEISYHPDQSLKSIHVEGIWKNSYEAEGYVKQFSQSNAPVCHTLVGYASGYYSEICQRPIYFKETSCKSMGSEQCYYVGKDLDQWNGEMDEELLYYENQTIVKELERTYEQLLEERNNISHTFQIHKRLTDELAKGNDLKSIADVVFEETDLPVLIEDAHFNPIASSGMTPQRVYEIQEALKQGQELKQTEVIEVDLCVRLITPIFLNQQLLGYCSFIKGVTDQFSKVDQMIIERTATVCSLYMLNEKNAFEATERMKGQFLEQIIHGQLLSKQDILKRGTFINIDLEKPHYIAVMKYDHQSINEKSDLLFFEKLVESVRNYFKGNSNVLIGQKGGQLVFLMQAPKNLSHIKEVFRALIGHLEEEYLGQQFSIGVSTSGEDIQLAPQLYHEASISLQMSNVHGPITLFEELGVVGILLHSKDQDAMYLKAKQLLGPLYQEDENAQEFLKTLYVFLSNGGKLEKTMDDLALSMSGLRYRIKRIETLTEHNLRDPNITYQLLLTLHFLISEGKLELK